MASMWPPKKNTAFTLSFTLYKNDGTIVANPGTYTKKVSIDGGDVADIAAAVTEENTTYGQLSLVIAAGEMNGDWIWIYITDDTAGTVPFTCTLYTTANTQDEIGAAITAIDDYIDTEIGALTTELAKVPKSDSTVSWNATALGDINAQVDLALNTAIPGGPTADSINERIATMDGTGVNVASQSNIDFGALQKASLNAATPASVGTVTGNVDGSVGSVAAGVTVTTNNDKTDYALTVADKDDIVDRAWDEPLTGALHNVATSAGRRLRQLGDSLASTVSDVTPSTTNFTTALNGYADDFFNDQTIRFTSGNLSGQVRIVSDFVGVGGEITVDEALTEAPANGDAFDILPQHTHTKTQIAEAVWNNATRTLSSFGTLVADIWAYATRTLSAFGFTVAATVADKTGYSLAVTPPTAAQVRAEIDSNSTQLAAIVADTNELQTDWANGGRLDLLLDAAGAAADPLLNSVPGAYTSGTAGHALGRISSANITVTSPVATDGTVTIIRGDDYNNTDGRALDWSNTDGDWPDLTGATIKFFMGSVEVTGSVVTPTGTGQKVRAEPTSAQTAKAKRGEYEYDVIATLATSSRIVTLASDRLIVDG